MTRGTAARAAAGPPGPDELRRWGIDPAWSRHVDVAGHDGVSRRWHLLERGPAGGSPAVTLLCLHGNPTWSYLWAPLLDRLGDRVRVVAPDLLGMGFSDRTSAPRRYAERVADLDDLIRALAIDGPLVIAAHDWGGAIAMGWAVDHGAHLDGLVLANTGIAVPDGRSAPRIIRLAAVRGVRDLVTRRTRLFVRGTLWLSRRRLSKDQRRAFTAPYRRAGRRRAIGDFVADIPFTGRHRSAAALESVAHRLGELDVPVLLVWGGRDPVFDDTFAADLLERFARADLHRVPGAGHLVVAESSGAGLPGASVAEAVDAWLTETVMPRPGGAGPGQRHDPRGHDDGHDEGGHDEGGRGEGGRGDPRRDPRGLDDGEPADPTWRPVWAALDERRRDAAMAFHDGASGRSVSFAELHRMVTGIGSGMAARGVARGDRVAVLVPPGPELVALVYACWRIGAVTVIADRGLGLGGLGRAVRGARVDAVVGARSALAAARALRWAPGADTIELGDVTDMATWSMATWSMATWSAAPALPDPPGPDDLAAVVFTSGATGPAKGVRYTHGGLAGQRDALAGLYRIAPDDRFVAAFAPFAIYGPALGITSAVPDVDVTTPGALTATALDAACAAIDATMVFASPAALANVVRTAAGPLPALATVRTVMSAGAPVPIRTLRAIAAMAPAASLHTPYGMTEVLPVADIELTEIEQARRDEVSADASSSRSSGDRPGVCVGRPVPGCDVVIAPVAAPVAAPVEPLATGRTGEVLVAAAWMSAGYDGLWHTERAARPVDASGRVWHRSGDVGHLDADGRLWIEGRVVHLIHSVDGPVTPVPVEVAVEALDEVDRAAAVGVGPLGVQQLVVVVEPTGRRRRRGRLRRAGTRGDGLADVELTERVRAALAPRPVAAVCVRAELPVDIRHNAKIDRTAVAAWATGLLAGSSSA